MLENSELKILIVDDERFNIDVVMGFLEDYGYQFNYTTNGKDALKAIFSNSFDLILLDVNMPGMDGLEVCRRVKSDEGSKDVPIIFLSAYSDIETISAAFAAGGVDYIRKPFNGLELIARVDTHLKLRRYVLELKLKQEKLATLASTDSLTGLSNRLRFTAILKKRRLAVKSNPSRLSLAYLKLDRLQRLNNVLGYKNADKALAQLADVLQKNIGEKRVASRLFSSDFAILAPETSLEAMMHLMKKINAIISKTNFRGVSVTCSIGVVEYVKDESLDSFMGRAEEITQSVQENGGDMLSSKILSKV